MPISTHGSILSEVMSKETSEEVENIRSNTVRLSSVQSRSACVTDATGQSEELSVGLLRERGRCITSTISRIIKPVRACSGDRSSALLPPMARRRSKHWDKKLVLYQDRRYRWTYRRWVFAAGSRQSNDWCGASGSLKRLLSLLPRGTHLLLCIKAKARWALVWRP